MPITTTTTINEKSSNRFVIKGADNDKISVGKTNNDNEIIISHNKPSLEFKGGTVGGKDDNGNTLVPVITYDEWGHITNVKPETINTKT
jgi:hypothetical protein